MTLSKRAKRICAPAYLEEEQEHLKHVLMGTGYTRITEHKRACRLGQTERSVVAEHALGQEGHEIEFKDSRLLVATNGYHSRLVREAIEIHKHPHNFNGKEWNHGT